MKRNGFKSIGTEGIRSFVTDPSMETQPLVHNEKYVAKNGTAKKNGSVLKEQSVPYQQSEKNSNKNIQGCIYASPRQRYLYYLLSSITWASLPPEILYMVFSQISGKKGMEKIVLGLTGYNLAESISGDASWTSSAMDLVLAFLLVDPNAEAAARLGLERIQGKLIIPQQHNKKESYAKKTNLSLKKLIYASVWLAMIVQFPIGGLADFIAIHEKGWIENEGLEIFLCVLLVTLSVAYYAALSAGDVLESAKQYLFDFKNSNPAKLYRQSKLAFADACLSAGATHIFRAFIFGYIPFKISKDVLHQGKLARMLVASLGFSSGFIVSLFTRSEQVIQSLLNDNDSDVLHQSNGPIAPQHLDDTLKIIYDKEAARNLSWQTKIATYIPGILLGLSRGFPAAALVYYYLHMLLSHHTSWSEQSMAAMQSFLSSLVGSSFLVATVKVHHEPYVRQAIKASEQSSVQQAAGLCSPDNIRYISALVLNGASQFIRTFISAEAIVTLLGEGGGLLDAMDNNAAVYLAIFIALQVAYVNAKYFQPKAESGIQRLFGGCANLFGWLARNDNSPNKAKEALEALDPDNSRELSYA